MRKHICTLVLAAVLSSPAHAQEQRETTREQAPLASMQGDVTPNGEDLARYYPPDALAQGIGGVAGVDCTVRADGGGDCEISLESPREMGFGRAVQDMMREQWIETQPNEAPSAGARARRFLSFDPGPPPTITDVTAMERVVWLDRPGVPSFARLYPRAALHNGVEGRVVLDCIVKADLGLDCEVVSEHPLGHGFGEATLRLSEEFRIAPQTQRGVGTIGARVRVPIRWSIRR
jgi:hypothetical protein